MDLLSAIALGVVQGLTEFLPISSSGHLAIGQHLLGWKEPNIFFDVSLHLGTFAAVLIVFWKDVGGLVKGGCAFAADSFKGRFDLADSNKRVFFLVFVGSIPTALMGFFGRHWVESLFMSLTAVGFNLLLTGTFLWITRYAASRTPERTSGRTTWRHALIVGIAQGFALAPGISRSGSTISAGLLVGLDREWAGRYSFLLFVPAVAGALALEIGDVDWSLVAPVPVLGGTLAAALTGTVALKLLLKTVRQGKFHLFAPYCWAVGLICLLSQAW
ncbi:MAG: undecaprenyl-diphosphate phosphatase [Thermodesulfobacteriota bacterium]|nr:undecaprenyl-diphosphate phosphatase [Thermodesulfobacteriota bacterium]